MIFLVFWVSFALKLLILRKDILWLKQQNINVISLNSLIQSSILKNMKQNTANVLVNVYPWKNNYNIGYVSICIKNYITVNHEISSNG